MHPHYYEQRILRYTVLRSQKFHQNVQIPNYVAKSYVNNVEVRQTIVHLLYHYNYNYHDGRKLKEKKAVKHKNRSYVN